MSEIAIVVCPKCNNARDSEAWNESTLNSFGAPLTPVIDAHSNECSYICPSCNTEVDGVSLQTYGWQQGEIERLNNELDKQYKQLWNAMVEVVGEDAAYYIVGKIEDDEKGDTKDAKTPQESQETS